MRPAGLTAPACWRRRSVFSLGRGGGGCEIRTREGLPPTRFPTMLARVHRGSGPSANCTNTIRANTGERPRTGVNETTNETAAESGRLTLASSTAANRWDVVGRSTASGDGVLIVRPSAIGAAADRHPGGHDQAGRATPG